MQRDYFFQQALQTTIWNPIGKAASTLQLGVHSKHQN